MTITLTGGWWMVPLLVTVVAFGLASVSAGRLRSGGDYDFATPLIALSFLGMALIASLVAWLTWSLIA